MTSTFLTLTLFVGIIPQLEAIIERPPIKCNGGSNNLFCDYDCLRKGFSVGKCNRNTSLCECEYRTTTYAPHRCPNSWAYCQNLCRRFGDYYGKCSDNGHCVCRPKDGLYRENDIHKLTFQRLPVDEPGFCD